MPNTTPTVTEMPKASGMEAQTIEGSMRLTV
jgi:hypothetical protein